jgi:hypothetical protein
MNQQRVLVTLLATALAFLAPLASFGQTPRPLVVISDVHLGLGKTDNGRWDPHEDFRWSKALAGFLDYFSERFGDKVDLVVAGDFVELWQRPASIACRGDGGDLGCTLEEMGEVAKRVVRAHQTDLKAIGAFALKGTNRVYLVT